MLRLLLLLLLLPAPDEGVYVGVGYGGRRLVSKDGIAWEISAEWAVDGKDDSNNLMGIAYGKGRFVAVGGGGWTRDTQAGHILVSKNGRDWTEVRKAPNRINPVVFGGGRFVAGGSDRVLLWSEDGETWTSGGKIDFKDWAFWFRRGVYGNGVFLLMGNHGKDQKAYWCAVSKNGEAIDHFQTDLPVVAGLAHGAGHFVAVGKKTAFTSADGLTWSALPKRIPCHLLWGDEKISIGTTWPGQMWHSTDGATWTKGAPLTPNGMNQVVYGEVGK